MGLIAKGLGRLAMVAAAGLLLYLGFVIVNGTVSAVTAGDSNPDRANRTAAQKLFDQGKEVFRFDTFGDEAFWGGALQLHRAIEARRSAASGLGSAPRLRSPSASRSTRRPSWTRSSRRSLPDKSTSTIRPRRSPS